MNTVTENKFNKLKSNIKKLNKIVVGFSGGVDSTLILKVSIDELGGENVWAVTGDSESLMPEELTLCRELAGRLGLSEKNFIEIKTNEIETTVKIPWTGAFTAKMNCSGI
jgi:PP-loop superfamily ATP-utilizing enzyme